MMDCQIIFRSPIHSNGGCIFADPTEIQAGEVTDAGGVDGGRGSGRTHGIRREGYQDQQRDALLETRRKRILREDDDIIALIMALVTRDLL